MRFPTNEIEYLESGWHPILPVPPVHLLVEGSCSIEGRSFDKGGTIPGTVTLPHPTQVGHQLKHRGVVHLHLVNVLCVVCVCVECVCVCVCVCVGNVEEA